MNPNRLLPLALLAAAACTAPVVDGEPAPAPAPANTGAVETRDEPDYPGGLGTLPQDAFTIPLRADALLIKVTPLAESITRLAAPDTYRRLHATAETHLEEARRATFGAAPAMFLVSFFSYEQDVGYRPEELQIVHQGQVLRPTAVLPVTSGWGRGRLQQRELQSAVYVFREPVNYDLPIALRYEGREVDPWTSMLPTLERERALVRSRAASN